MGEKFFIFALIGTAGFFEQIGLRPALVWATLVPFAEFSGGLALVVGLLTRYAALILALDMIVAITVVHLPKGFPLPEGYEFALTLLGGNLTFATPAIWDCSSTRWGGPSLFVLGSACCSRCSLSRRSSRAYARKRRCCAPTSGASTMPTAPERRG